MWLFHLHSAVKIETFYPAFPLSKSAVEAFCWLSLWNFEEKTSTIFYDTAKRKGSLAAHGGIPLHDQGVGVSPVLESLPPKVRPAEAVPALRMKPQGRARSAPCAALEAGAEIFYAPALCTADLRCSCNRLFKRFPLAIGTKTM
ncbi:hypothetical protein [uncultured Bilophila sp.]|uniref:hypothetical protein n=1 Tax=uncultured Bilophila sp. TaxID=529385 RepID=UPI00266F2A81|nr:hypothetical protein [uncultured Bilophila sp.]